MLGFKNGWACVKCDQGNAELVSALFWKFFVYARGHVRRDSFAGRRGEAAEDAHAAGAMQSRIVL